MRTLFFMIVSTAFAAWLFLYGLPGDVADRAKMAISELKNAPTKVKEAATDFLATPAEKREKVISKLEQKIDQAKATTDKDTLIRAVEEAGKLITELRGKNEDKPNLLSTALTKVVESVFPASLIGSSEPVNCEKK